MLPRILEPEVMGTVAEARDYDAMDHAAVNRQFVADFLALGSMTETILDVGTGTAQIPIEFCRQSATGLIVAIDLAKEMLAVAQRNVAAAGFAERIRLQLVDAKTMPFVDGKFHAVMSNSIIHHLPEPAGTFAEIKRVCAISGRIFVRDLLRPADATTLRHIVETYAGDANASQQKMFAESLHASLTLTEVQEFVGRLGFPAQSVKQTSDRHWTWSAIRAE